MSKLIPKFRENSERKERKKFMEMSEDYNDLSGKELDGEVQRTRKMMRRIMSFNEEIIQPVERRIKEKLTPKELLEFLFGKEQDEAQSE